MSSDLEKLMAMVTTARADLASRSGSGMRPVKPPAGVSRWRILPGWNPDNRVKFYHEFGQHWIKSNGELLGTAVCDSVTFGHDCKYCRALGQEFSQMKVAGLTKDSAPWKAISEMNAGTTIVVNALCTDGPNKNLEQPVMLSLGKKVFEEFLSNLANALKEGDNILDLEAGSDISIEKTGSGFDTRYSLTLSSSVIPEAFSSKSFICLSVIAGMFGRFSCPI